MSSKDPPRVNEPSRHGEAADAVYQRTLEELRAKWDARLRPIFDAPDFGEHVDAMMDACGRTKIRPKAGETF